MCVLSSFFLSFFFSKTNKKSIDKNWLFIELSQTKSNEEIVFMELFYHVQKMSFFRFEIRYEERRKFTQRRSTY